MPNATIVKMQKTYVQTSAGCELMLQASNAVLSCTCSLTDIQLRTIIPRDELDTIRSKDERTQCGTSLPVDAESRHGCDCDL